MTQWPPAKGKGVEHRTVKLGIFPGGGLYWTVGGWLANVWASNAPANNAATITFYDGVNSTGEPIGVLYLAPGTTQILSIDAPGWPLNQGLYIDCGGQTITGSLVIAREIP